MGGAETTTTRTDTLPNFLTDVANAIRTKKGTTAQIQPVNYDTEIASIVTGLHYSNLFSSIDWGTSNTTLQGYLYDKNNENIKIGSVEWNGNGRTFVFLAGNANNKNIGMAHAFSSNGYFGLSEMPNELLAHDNTVTDFPAIEFVLIDGGQIDFIYDFGNTAHAIFNVYGPSANVTYTKLYASNDGKTWTQLADNNLGQTSKTINISGYRYYKYTVKAEKLYISYMYFSDVYISN